MIVLQLGKPPTAPLSINQERNMHWADRGRRLKPWRELTWAAAVNAGLAATVAGRPARITVHLPVQGALRRDPHNFVPTVKSVVDGLVRAGVWPDDGPEWVTVTEPVLWHESHAEVRITPLTDSPGPGSRGTAEAGASQPGAGAGPATTT